MLGDEFAGGGEVGTFAKDLDSGMILKEGAEVEAVDFAIVDDECFHGWGEFSGMVTVKEAPPVGRLLGWIFP